MRLFGTGRGRLSKEELERQAAEEIARVEPPFPGAAPPPAQQTIAPVAAAGPAEAKNGQEPATSRPRTATTRASAPTTAATGVASDEDTRPGPSRATRKYSGRKPKA